MELSTFARPGARVTPTRQPSPESKSELQMLASLHQVLLSRFTCEECVEGMEFVEAYMRDPLWVAEYTLYLEQNFCVHDQVSAKRVINKIQRRLSLVCHPVYNTILQFSKVSVFVLSHTKIIL